MNGEHWMLTESRQQEKQPMTQRTCGNCRWWRQQYASVPYGYCHRNAPTQGPLAWVRPEVDADSTCGEWADGSITPEQERKRELVRRFAVAIADGLARDVKMTAQETVEHIWRVAEQLADAEPGNSGREI